MSGPLPAPSVTCTGVGAAYDRSAPVLSGVSATFAAGRFTAVIGPNGSGKSTLLSCLARQLPYLGTITVGGDDVAGLARRRLARRIAFLPQSPSAPEGVSVRGLVERGRQPHRRAFAPLGPADRVAIDHALERLSLTALAERPLAEISGGQRQRAWIALVLAQDTPVLLLDEPTSFLDLAHQAALLEIARELAIEGRTVVAVLHDLNLATAFADDLLVLDAGRVATHGRPAEVVTCELLAEVFDLHADVVPDPVSGVPVVLPRPRSVPPPRPLIAADTERTA